jgi:hypothetical protein
VEGLGLGEASNGPFLLSWESSIRTPPYGVFIKNTCSDRFGRNYWFHTISHRVK